MTLKKKPDQHQNREENRTGMKQLFLKVIIAFVTHREIRRAGACLKDNKTSSNITAQHLMGVEYQQQGWTLVKIQLKVIPQSTFFFLIY